MTLYIRIRDIFLQLEPGERDKKYYYSSRFAQGTKTQIFTKRVGGDKHFEIIHDGSRFVSERDTIHNLNRAKWGQEIKTKINP